MAKTAAKTIPVQESAAHRPNIPVTPYGVLVMLSLLCVLAFGVRLYRITDPAMDYMPTRQYHSAILARQYYFQGNPAIDRQRKEIADINFRSEGVIEPPINEHIAAWGYRILGQETITLPRVLSSLYWVLGGIFLFLCCWRASSGRCRRSSRPRFTCSCPTG